jgi:uncharacterized membrane protein
MPDVKKSAGRLGFIDWTRGLAAVVMLQGHTFDSFTRTDLRDKGPYILSQFLGGLPPAIFLFLTGITFAFLMHSEERKGASAWQRVLAALKRARYLFLLAFLFRIQLYVFGFPTSPAGELLRVDILNCMGMAMLIFAAMAVFTTQERIRLCIILGLVIAALSPLVSLIDTSGVPSLLRNYFLPSYKYFGFFPWASFLAFGMAAGSILRTVKHEDMGKVMLWTFGTGLGLIVAAGSPPVGRKTSRGSPRSTATAISVVSSSRYHDAMPHPASTPMAASALPSPSSLAVSGIPVSNIRYPMERITTPHPISALPMPVPRSSESRSRPGARRF